MFGVGPLVDKAATCGSSFGLRLGQVEIRLMFAARAEGRSHSGVRHSIKRHGIGDW